MIHPGAWVAWALCAGLVAMLTTNPFYLLPLVAVTWLVYTARRVPGPAGRSFSIFLRFAVMAVLIRTALVFFGTIDASNVAWAALEGLRLGVMLIVFGTFNAVADPYGVLRLAPRRFYEAALAAALALSIAPRTIAAFARVRAAQRMRGIEITRRRMLPALAVPVLETGMEEALMLAESMDARGHGSGRRTRYRPLPWTWSSTSVAAAAASALIVFIGAAIAARGGLAPSTFPLTWPGAEGSLVAAVFLLALPALIPSGER